MAKSLRSKFKRKIRAIARAKKAPKELKRLEATVARGKAFEANNADKVIDENVQEEDKMDITKKSTLNLKTMKLADGSYPKWLNQGQIKKLKKKAAQTKRQSVKKARSRR